MNKTQNAVGLALIAITLAGCSMGNVAKTVFNFKTDPLPPPVPLGVGNNLSMPQDLQLPAPGPTVDAYQTNVGTGEGAAHDLAEQVAKEPPPTAPAVFAEFNIALSDANGKPKSPDQLAKELKAARLARKREANPNYGTIRNFRNVFKDQ
jgi:hypothetical protein